ncbi:hypothetical protein [Rhizosphaericola mali]|uniref:Uncharacterized protein n=1 Tax=Rhizosphaericola mali TaxID=2545455 RepID=A0A5P2G502_9BACT|nr:hypothetical protein [Rhizosphaericola mali]QES89768.1 hypothetical protein E0W69_014235 [Rhizosphaericola mali]
MKKSIFAAVLFAALAPLSLLAQQLDNSEPQQERPVMKFKDGSGVGKKGEWYFSWGYNKEWYTGSNLHIKQPSLGNDYTIVDVRAHDHPGWDQDFFHKAISIPQYNYRLGFYFKDNWAFEINFDHTKYVVSTNQLLHIKGTVNGQQVDEFISNRPDPTTGQRFLQYQLNNGANFLMANLVHRKHLTSFNTNWFDAALLLKGGLGVMIPHVDAKIDGKQNNADFQFGGFGADAEAAIRGTFGRYVYLEFANKVVGTAYSHLHIYDGSAKQTFGTYEMVLSLGIVLPGKRKG